jgi:5-methylcytosine-specific restriction endonuclease McrA
VTAIPKKVRTDVLERDDFTCQRCKVSVLGRAYSLHHRKGRHGADAHARSNLVVLCGSGASGCHGHVHQHPTESYRDGWMVHRLGGEDPEDVPLIDVAGRMFGLTNDGQVIAWTTTQEGIA